MRCHLSVQSLLFSSRLSMPLMLILVPPVFLILNTAVLYKYASNLPEQSMTTDDRHLPLTWSLAPSRCNHVLEAHEIHTKELMALISESFKHVIGSDSAVQSRSEHPKRPRAQTTTRFTGCKGGERSTRQDR